MQNLQLVCFGVLYLWTGLQGSKTVTSSSDTAVTVTYSWKEDPDGSF